jgi:signal transduction histidine kinase/ActR/RegA family two-component response regulator
MLQANSDLGLGQRSQRRTSGLLSLRARLLLLVVASIVPLFAFSLASQYLQYRDAIAAAGRQTLELARSLSSLAEQELQTRMVALQVLALSPALHANDLATFRAEAEAAIAEQFPGSNLILLQENGQQLMNTLLPPGAPLPIRPNMETTRQVFATGRPAVSNFFMGAIGPRPVVAIDVPVKRDDGSVAYVLSSNPRLDDFAEIIRRQRFPNSWIVSIFDRGGVNVARTPNPERFVGQPAGAVFRQRMLAEREGVSDSTSREGIPLIAAFSHSAKFGWAGAVGIPRAELVAPAIRAAMQTLAVGSILLAVSLALALLVARQITGPIAALRRLAAAGDADAVLDAPPTGLREADEVVRALRTAEENRRRSEHEKEQARAALHTSEEQLRQSQKMEAVGQLTGGLAHDFNNLLLVIIGNLDELLAGRNDPATVRELARHALDAAQRGADLTRSLLAFARRQPLRPRRVAINDLVSGIAKLLGRTLGERIEVSLELAADVWPVVIDPAQLEAALANLATNARDAMPKGGRLTIVTANRHLDEDYGSQHADVIAGDYTMIEVSDTGVGMPPDVVAQIFDPFFTTKGRGQGTGLGLSMVFGFMKQSGGHINVYSEPGVGTTFRLYLPRDEHAERNDERAAAETSAPGGGETVLVVEDNPSLRRLVVLQLTTLGYRVQESENAAAALAVLEAQAVDGGQHIDLLLADVVMPGKLDGYDLARTVLERWPSTKIVLMSGFPGTNLDRSPAAHIPLLSKPYRREDLARTLRAAMDDQPSA